MYEFADLHGISDCLIKHCDSRALDFMLAGHFKFGTLAGYANAEGGGLMDDHEEGKSHVATIGDVKNASFKLGSSTYENISFVGCTEGFRQDVNVDWPVFCASSGPYSKDRHKAIIEGDDANGYGANPSYLHYLVLNTRKLLQATVAAANCIYFPHGAQIEIRYVKYEKRGVTRDASTMSLWMNDWTLAEEAHRLTFTKPRRFAVEQEARIAVRGYGPLMLPAEPIFSKDCSPDIHRLFKASIVSYGQVNR